MPYAAVAGAKADRSVVREHDSDAGDGRGSAGQLRPSRHPHGARAGRPLPVAALPAVRSSGPHLAQPRPRRLAKVSALEQHYTCQGDLEKESSQ